MQLYNWLQFPVSSNPWKTSRLWKQDWTIEYMFIWGGVMIKDFCNAELWNERVTKTVQNLVVCTILIYNQNLSYQCLAAGNFVINTYGYHVDSLTGQQCSVRCFHGHSLNKSEYRLHNNGNWYYVCVWVCIEGACKLDQTSNLEAPPLENLLNTKTSVFKVRPVLKTVQEIKWYQMLHVGPGEWERI